MAEHAIFITGGAKRIGATMALYFARHGYDIALHYHHSNAEAKKLQSDIEALGATCALFPLDLTDIKSIPSLMRQVHQAMPHCVALINNASVFTRASFLDTDEALFDRQFTTNLKAPFFLSQAFANVFTKGCIVNLLDSDISKAQVSHFTYLLSKKAFADFTRMAAQALGPYIRVNGICPGVVLPSSELDKDYMEKLAPRLPLRELASVEEVAEAARWLITQRHITGQFMYVDGGQHVL